ncbi:MAG: hypothetical protein ACFE8A_07860 [Candidatus Hodarchaeota archaeon]
MVYIMLTGWVPAEKARVFGKRVLEGIRKFPTDESVSKLIVQAAGTSNGCIRAFSISEVVDGKITEAITRANNFALFYAEEVGEGFKYNVEILMSAMEAMRVIGLEMPE